MSFSRLLYPIRYIVPLLLFWNCTKQTAVPGSKGETGEAAPQGNLRLSNVIYSTVDSSDWNVANAEWEYVIYSGSFNGKPVGWVEVNVFIENDGVWWRLPNIKGDIFTQYSIADSVIRLKQFKLHSALTYRPPKTSKFRTVILSPS